MSRKHRCLIAFIGLLLFVAFGVAVPAFATETEDSAFYTSSGSGGVISFPEPPAPPTPTPEPTPLPTPDPTPVPTPEPTPEPTPVPQDPPADDPDNNGNDDEDPDNRPGGTVIRSTPTPTPVPNGTPRPSETPSASAGPSQPTSRPNGRVPGSTNTPEQSDSDGSRYVTFARLNQKNNSVALTLFYGGSGCVLLGLAGIASLVVFFLRGRRQDEREAILLEIENAENRQLRPHPVGNQPPMLYSGPPQNAHSSPQPRQTARSSGGGLPELNQLRRVPPTVQTPPPTGTTPKKPESNGPLVPTAASMYTEEFALNEPEPAPVSSPVKKTAAPRPEETPKISHPAETKPPEQSIVRTKPPESPAAKIKPSETKPLEPSIARTKLPEAKAVPAKPAAESKPAGQKATSRPQTPKAPSKKAAGPTAPPKPEPDFSATAKTTIFPAQKPDRLPEEKQQTSGERSRARPKQPVQVPGQLSLLGESEPTEKE